MLLGVLAGPDPLDPRSLQAPPAPAYYPIVPRPGDKPLDGRADRLDDRDRDVTRQDGLGARHPRAAARRGRAVPRARRDDRRRHARHLEPRQHDLLQGRRARPVHRRERLREHGLRQLRERVRPQGHVRADGRTRCSTAASRRASAAPPRSTASRARTSSLQRAAKYTPEDLFGAYQVRREYCEAWAKVFADNDLHACLWPQKVQTPPDRADDFTGGFCGRRVQPPEHDRLAVRRRPRRSRREHRHPGRHRHRRAARRPTRRPADRDRLPGALPLPPRRPDRALAMADPTGARMRTINASSTPRASPSKSCRRTPRTPTGRWRPPPPPPQRRARRPPP